MDNSILRLLEDFYKKNPEILEDMVLSARNREAAYMLYTGHFGKRPYYIDSEEDIVNLVKRGAISFHMSVERWYNPLNLSTKLKKRELNELREGWDLLLDIDSKDFEIAKHTTKLLIDVLINKYNISPIYVKFSGGSGFHIVVPWELFPETILIHKKDEYKSEQVKNMFPDLARLLALYLMSLVENKLYKTISVLWDIRELIKHYNIDVLEENFSPFHIVNIDTVAISSRHLFRMPYSINEKSYRLSIPIKTSNILEFDPSFASIDVYSYENIPFLSEEIKRKDLLSNLILDALAWDKLNKLEKERLKTLYELSNPSSENIEERHVKRAIKKFKGKVPPTYFPPCIKNILQGVEDGRKRSLFILINFLYNLGWGWDDISKLVYEWNENNPDPLREKYIEYQIEWHRQKYSKGNKYLPPNCSNEGYYKDIGVCKPDSICKLIKNPISYPYKKLVFSKDIKSNSGEGK